LILFYKIAELGTYRWSLRKDMIQKLGLQKQEKKVPQYLTVNTDTMPNQLLQT
jgi:hypothetical protein